MRKLFYLALAMLICSYISVHAATLEGGVSTARLKEAEPIKNQIFDSATNLPIPYAKVILPKENYTNYTDANGYFSLKTKVSDNSILAVAKDGYRPFSLTLNQNSLSKPIIVGIDKSKPLDIVIDSTVCHLGDDAYSDTSANSTEFNGQYLMNGSIKDDINLQVGIQNDTQSVIKLDKDLFANATATVLLNVGAGKTIEKLSDEVYKNDTTAREFLNKLDVAIEDVTVRTTTIGGVQQRIISAMDAADVMKTSMTSAVALIQDADIAEESSNYVKHQILQQTSASMLATANQAPSIALQLLG